MLAVSLNLVNGLTGQFSIGHAGFMAIGGYVSAVLLMHGPEEDPFRIFFVLAVLAGAGVAALAGYLVGKPSLRLRGDYLAIVTLGFGEIIRVIIENTPFFGGAIGLSPIPHRADFAWIWAVAIGTILVAKRLREHQLYSRTVSLKLRNEDFVTITRASSFDHATQLDGEIAGAVT